jgi:hypothetical protein
MPLLPTIPLRASTRSTFRASRRIARGLALACALGAAGLAQAQLFSDPADWKEEVAPKQPDFNKDRLIGIDMPGYMSLKFGVDPDTIKITGDGVVSYVVVATNSEGGGFNAFHEGVHCATEQYKTYARYNEGKWDVVANSEWKPIGDRNSLYTKSLVNQGMCRGHAPQASLAETIRQLKRPVAPW